MSNDFQQASRSLEGERRRKRIITDARREQNRAASRAYRQRQRQASQTLQQNAGSCPRRYHELKPRCLSDTLRSISAPSSRAEVSSTSSQLQNNTYVDLCLYGITSQPVSLEAITDSGGAIQDLFPQDKDVNQVVHFPLPETAAAFDPGIDGRFVGKCPAFEPTASSLSITILNEDGSATSETSIPSSKSLIITSQDHLFSEASHCQGLLTSEFGNQGLQLESLSHSELDIVSEGQSQTQIDSMYLPMPFLLPNFYKPSLRRSKLPPSIAYMHVAILLGITLEDLTNVKHCSPFYRRTTAEDDPKALLAAAAIPSLPAHLQPTLPQILFPHNPNLDLLPFPVLRARAITLAATTPQLVNPKELKMDILSDGLICWHDRNDDNNWFGQPWDIHSWEAASWFKKKWRMLFEDDSHYLY
ncbi:hypothetical protein HDV63DRAFT_408884 [Trichoderma sp. SZMC 28014]